MLSVIAFVLKYWKVFAGLAAAAAIVVGLSWVYAEGRSEGYAAAQAKWSAKYAADEAARQQAESRRQEAAKEAENEFFRRQAMRDAQQAKETEDWKAKAEGYEKYIDGIETDGPCLLDGDLGRVRDLWNRKPPGLGVGGSPAPDAGGKKLLKKDAAHS